ncbi:MAG: hypothetical protein K8R36_08760 [Planctomycetales bacterium]|nr:hypothetical protein [Planctomycetales bacterium]
MASFYRAEGGIRGVLWRFGINPSLEVPDQTGWPIRLPAGQPLTGLSE